MERELLEKLKALVLEQKKALHSQEVVTTSKQLDIVVLEQMKALNGSILRKKILL